MRRVLRWIGRAALAVLALICAVILLEVVSHQIQLHRLHKLAAISPQTFIVNDAPTFVVQHVRVIDGTGAPAKDDQSIVVSGGRIQWVGNASEQPMQPGAKVIDAKGSTVIPGLVMMHEHLFTSAPAMSPTVVEQSTAFPLLYLANGVTTARTTGSIDAAADLRIKQRVDAGEQIGPELFLTAPYLDGGTPQFPQMHALADAAEARRQVDNYAAQGFTSFKAYTSITPAELQAAITEAHAKGLKITGHLCSVGFTEAANMGIDNLEHGLLVDTEFYSAKQPGKCPPFAKYLTEYKKLDIQSAPVQTSIQNLVAHHVAMTSTLAVMESEFGAHSYYGELAKQNMTWQAWLFSGIKRRLVAGFHAAPLIPKAEQYERAFVAAGGTLLAGSDPTGDGSVLAGQGDLREIELLVQAGFTPLDALRIATQGGADYLGIGDRTGTIAAGKQADFVLIDGDPSQNIENLRNIRVVYKRGVGYDSAAIQRSVDGVVGLADSR